ncbi:hypothetical protein ACUXCC_005547 [Cytobacillus horneckiae]|uniref:hypothetical protein n=1 Tax=Cytobacillus horneckiae TaxID=549687 RepID=UPI0019CFD764|nr:hypothetical protein [Cytobacillus horneckiae]MBN6890035.1 hypothetical protein [Cytobacillus horneckiae]
MSQSVEEWWEKNKIDMFWYKHRKMMGFNPDEPMNIQERLYWKRLNNEREKCLASTDPEYAILRAPYFDKQLFLEKWWDKLNIEEKEKYLLHVWGNKGGGNLYGYDWWLPYFNEVGFLTNIDESLPTKPVTLYRGVVPFFSNGMSWTSQIDLARHFANSFSIMGEKKLYKTEVDPEDILGIVQGDVVNYNGKVEKNGLEYVINHRKLRMIEEIG